MMDSLGFQSPIQSRENVQPTIVLEPAACSINLAGYVLSKEIRGATISTPFEGSSNGRVRNVMSGTIEKYLVKIRASHAQTRDLCLPRFKRTPNGPCVLLQLVG